MSQGPRIDLLSATGRWEGDFRLWVDLQSRASTDLWRLGPLVRPGSLCPSCGFHSLSWKSHIHPVGPSKGGSCSL